MGMEELQFEQKKENKNQRQGVSVFDAQEDEARLQNVCIEEEEKNSFQNCRGKKLKCLFDRDSGHVPCNIQGQNFTVPEEAIAC